MENTYCTNCGTPLDKNGMCPNCGAVYSNDAFMDGSYNGGYSKAEANRTSYDLFQLASEAAAKEQASAASQEPSDAPQEDYPADDSAFAYDSPVPQTEAHTPPAEADSGDNSRASAAYAFGETSFLDDVREGCKKGMAVASQVFWEWLGCVKVFFTVSPLDASDKVQEGVHYAWAAFAGLNAIAAALFTAGMVCSSFNAAISKLIAAYPMLINVMERFTFDRAAGIFFVSLLFYAALFFAEALCEHVFLTTAGQKPTFDEMCKLTAIAYFPMTLACAAGFLFSFFLWPVAVMLVLCGMIESFILLRDLTGERAGEHLPFWAFMINHAAQIVVAMVLISLALVMAF